MSTHKYIDRICLAVLALTLLITVLFLNGERLGLSVVVDEDAEAASTSAWFTANDLKADWDSASATVITLKGDSASVSGGGAFAYKNKVIITSPGKFILRGTLDNGSVRIAAENSSKIWLLLDGVSITCEDDACLRVDQADKVFLTLAEGTENSLASGAEYSEASLADGTDGVLFSHDDLTINGSGSLTISAAYGHGIAANDALVITGGRLSVTAPLDAIHANDSLRICNAELSLNAGDDGLLSKNAGSLLYIESGSITIESADDAIHSGGDVQICGGALRITAGDDGVHADGAVSVSGGSLDILDAYEGIEALTVELSGGETNILCRDDGINANGSTGFGGMQRPGMDSTGTTAVGSAADTWIAIRGGSLSIVNETARDADGLDSNGNLSISGGTIRISMSNSGSNSALDFGSESGASCLISGGEIIACGSYSMAESFDAESAQPSILYNFSAGAEAGTRIALEDSSGAVLLEYEAPCSFSSVVISSPQLKLGESYLVVIGPQVEAITLEENSASFGDAASGMFGGSMNWGGTQARRDFGGFGESGEKPQRPQGSDRPQRDENFTPPSGMPQMGEGMTPPSGMPQMDGEMSPPDAQTEETTAATSSVNAHTWHLVGLSFLALAVGILIAAKYKQ